MQLPNPALAVVLLVLSADIASAQDREPTTFRTGIDVLTISTAVVDERGQPITDLQAGDFTVTIAGTPRKVVSAAFLGGRRSAAVSGSSTSATESPAAAWMASPIRGRTVLFVVDRESLQSGGEKALFDAAAGLLDALTPADAAGAIGLPLGGVEPTREHDRVASALRLMTGSRPTPPWSWHITWDEARGIERDDKQVLAQVVYRECRGPRAEGVPVLEACDRAIPVQAREMLMTARLRAQSILSSLGAMADRLAGLQGPRHIILMSGGLLFDQQLLGDYTDTARRVAAAGVVLHVIHVDQPGWDSTSIRRVVTSPYGSRELSEGLGTLAAASGGAFFHGVGSAAGVFERIVSSITSFYELGVETTAADFTGKPREVSIGVNRANVTLRAPKEIVATAAAAGAPGPDPITKLLYQPTDVAGLPLRLATYNTRGDDPTALRVVLAAEIAGARPDLTGEWAFAVLDEGNAVANGRHALEAAEGGTWLVNISARLEPGRYRLRFAARTSDGRTGVIDVPLTVGLRTVSGFQLSDLIVGTAEANRLVPRGGVPQGAQLLSLIELLCADAKRLEQSRVALEIVPAGSAQPVQRLLMAARSGRSDTVLLNEARVDTRALPPGRYTANAIALVDNQPVGNVTRVFEVLPADGKQ